MFETLLKSIGSELSVKFGVAGTVIILLGWLVKFLFNKLIADKDSQIKLLSEENKEYRERFMAIMDKQFNFVPEKDGEKPKK